LVRAAACPWSVVGQSVILRRTEAHIRPTPIKHDFKQPSERVTSYYNYLGYTSNITDQAPLESDNVANQTSPPTPSMSPEPPEIVIPTTQLIEVGSYSTAVETQPGAQHTSVVLPALSRTSAAEEVAQNVEKSILPMYSSTPRPTKQKARDKINQWCSNQQVN